MASNSMEWNGVAQLLTTGTTAMSVDVAGLVVSYLDDSISRNAFNEWVDRLAKNVSSYILFKVEVIHIEDNYFGIDPHIVMFDRDENGILNIYEHHAETRYTSDWNVTPLIYAPDAKYLQELATIAKKANTDLDKYECPVVATFVRLAIKGALKTSSGYYLDLESKMTDTERDMILMTVEPNVEESKDDGE